MQFMQRRGRQRERGGDLPLVVSRTRRARLGTHFWTCGAIGWCCNRNLQAALLVCNNKLPNKLQGLARESSRGSSVVTL